MGKSSRSKLARKSQDAEAKQIQAARETAHALIAEAQFPLAYPQFEVNQIVVLSESVYEEAIAAGIRRLSGGVTKDSLADFSADTMAIFNKYEAIAARIFREHVKVDPDCKPGCNWCCHLRVTLKVCEAAQLHRAIESLPAETKGTVVARVQAFVEETNRMKPEAVLRSTRLCPLNENGNCLVYENRPLVCRTAHSYSVRACRTYVERGEVIRSKTSAFVREIGRFSAVAASQVLAHYGVDQRRFEINDLLLGLISDKKVTAAIEKKKTAPLDPYFRADVEQAALAEISNIVAS